MPSPYANRPESEWLSITTRLVQEHKIKAQELVEIVLESWQSIFASSLGGFIIGQDIFPAPQIMSFLLHELVALNLQQRHPRTWRKGIAKNEKDVVCRSDETYSFEIKASSDKKHIFGNRSYAQAETSLTRKSKSGYYLTINFEKFVEGIPSSTPAITLIRFGYLEHTDWQGQAAQTGQQARLLPITYNTKLLTLYSAA
ncbi:MAG: ScaI family restriction endonuclease [Candidatus Kapabacteria bacterium]|jgi:hypothetical protein|nr:ScaI family restriction endonuclease [Candidatus Kapabacteria bacterium]